MLKQHGTLCLPGLPTGVSRAISMNKSLFHVLAICLLSGCAQLPLPGASTAPGAAPAPSSGYKAWTPWGAYANKKAANAAATVAGERAQHLGPVYSLKLGKSLAATLRANAAAIAELPLEEQALLDEYAQRVEVLAPGNRAVDESYRKFYTEELPEHDLKWALAQMRASRTIQKKDLSDVSRAPPEVGSAFALRNPQVKSLSGLRPLKASPSKTVKGRLADYRFVPSKSDKQATAKGAKGSKGSKSAKSAKREALQDALPPRTAKSSKTAKSEPAKKSTKASLPKVAKTPGVPSAGKSANPHKRAAGR